MELFIGHFLITAFIARCMNLCSDDASCFDASWLSIKRHCLFSVVHNAAILPDSPGAVIVSTVNLLCGPALLHIVLTCCPKKKVSQIPQTLERTVPSAESSDVTYHIRLVGSPGGGGGG